MKIILHFGMPKAGSNALQQLFHARRDLLLSQGILYPESCVGNPDRHHHLTIPAFEGKRLPTTFRKHSPNEAQKEFIQFWDHVKDQVSQAKPDLVILSTEALFRRLSPAGAHRLYNKLTQLTDDITTVAFIRQFPTYYISLVQQRILSLGSIPPLPKPSEILDALVSYEALFGSGAMRLFPYESKRDVVEDFCTLLSGYGITRDALGTLPGRANKSLSAAATYVLFCYQQNPPVSGDGPLHRYSGKLSHILKDLDSSLGLSRPELKDQARALLLPASQELETQLSARYGLRFREASPETTASAVPQQELSTIQHITNVPPQESIRLLEALSESPWAKLHSALPEWALEKARDIKENGV